MEKNSFVSSVSCHPMNSALYLNRRIKENHSETSNTASPPNQVSKQVVKSNLFFNFILNQLAKLRFF